MTLQTFLQTGLKSLSDIHDRAVRFVLDANQKYQQNAEMAKRQHLVKSLEHWLNDLHNNGTDYSDIKIVFHYRGRPDELNRDVLVNMTYFAPRRDAVAALLDVRKNVTIDYSSWKNLVRDVVAFADVYQKAFAQTYPNKEMKLTEIERKFQSFIMTLKANHAVDCLHRTQEQVEPR